MIVLTHFISFLVNEYFTPACLREVRDITREVVQCLEEAARRTCFDSCTERSRDKFHVF